MEKIRVGAVKGISACYDGYAPEKQQCILNNVISEFQRLHQQTSSFSDTPESTEGPETLVAVYE